MANPPLPDRDLAGRPFAPDIERLNQHFLNPATAARIVQLIRIDRDDTVLEIGAGTGTLTAAIAAAATSARILAAEPDHRCEPALRRLQARYDNVALRLDQIQNVPPVDLEPTTVIIANPPFSVLEHLTRLLHTLPNVRAAVLCVSRRWAATVTAQPGAPAYGVPAVVIQAAFIAAVVGTVDGQMFTPPIRQPAALLTLDRRPRPDLVMTVVADALLHRGGARVKDLLRSRRLRSLTSPDQYDKLINDPSVGRLQQRRLTTLSRHELSVMVQHLTTPED